MLILGLLLVAVAGVAGTVGVLSNRGTGHQVPGGFDALGYTMHGPTGQLFFWGIIVGCVATLRLVLVLGGLRGGLKRRGTARRNASWRRTSEREKKSAQDASPTAATTTEPTREPVAAAPSTVPEPVPVPAPEIETVPAETVSAEAAPAVDKVGS